MKRRLKCFYYAWCGIRSSFLSEPNMKIHLLVTIIVVTAGALLRITITEWILCFICIGLVFGMELINTSIENIVDLVSPEHHKLAEKAKDAAAGAVLVCAVISVITGLLIFVPKIFALLY